MPKEASQRASMVEHYEGCLGFKDAGMKATGVCYSWCWGHMKCEPSGIDYFAHCRVCEHHFQTVEDLIALNDERCEVDAQELLSDQPLMLAAHNEVTRKGTRYTTKDVEKVYHCPVCMADFRPPVKMRR